MSSIVELLVLWAEHLWVVIECEVIEHFDCSFHAQGAHCQALLVISNGLLVGHEVTCLDQHLLKLEQVQMDVLVLFQELVLVMGLLHLLVLVSHVPDSSLDLDLHVLDLFGRPDQLLCTLLQFSKVCLPS